MSMKNCLIATTVDAKTALKRTKSLLDITSKILSTTDENWIDILLLWSEENIIQQDTNFPKNKSDFLKVKHISLRWNRLKSLPNELFNLVQLEILELNNNALEILPSKIGNLVNLKVLNLNINSLQNLPQEIVNLKKLEMINIKNNKYLELDEEQISWLIELKQNGCTVIYDSYKFHIGVE